jgi:hypothetical protein
MQFPLPHPEASGLKSIHELGKLFFFFQEMAVVQVAPTEAKTIAIR